MLLTLLSYLIFLVQLAEKGERNIAVHLFWSL